MNKKRGPPENVEIPSRESGAKRRSFFCSKKSSSPITPLQDSTRGKDRKIPPLKLSEKLVGQIEELISTIGEAKYAEWITEMRMKLDEKK